jgi:prepilin-type N-terminal cleavage/methylation domain-containing protein
MDSFKNQKGFTLIEIMITMVVVVVVVLGFLTSSTAIQTQGRAAFERSMALQDANRVIEQMRNAAASGTFPGNVTGTFSGSVSGFGSLPTGSNETITVSYASATADPLDATITVSYLENGRRAQTASLRTYITQRA